MAKRSHRIASRQAAVSKERKKKKKGAQTAHRQMPADAPFIPDEASSAVASDASVEIVGSQPLTQTAPLPQPEGRALDPRYQYVISDVKRIGILGGAILVVLIVLAFVVG